MSLRLALALGVALLLGAAASSAQSSREAEQRLQKVRTELKSVAAERRKLEGQRGDASRKLRAADEEVGKVGRAVRETERALERDADALADLQRRRDALDAKLAGKRTELRQLLRAAYTVGDDAPLKALLAQDRLDEAQRTLAYHRYAQRDRAERIRAITAELREVDVLQAEITQRRAALDDARRTQKSQLAQLVDQLDARYRDRASRERALGEDAKSLQQLLAKLRAAAAKAAREKAAAERAAKRAAAKAKASGDTAPPPKPRAVVTGPALQVGGLSWPVSGSLVSRYGGTLPDGRKSEGVLIAAAAGTTVKAVADGRVVFSDWMNGYGLILIVDHGNGYMSLYAHNDALLRDAGDSVRRGDALASVGNSGGQGRAGLYFELRRNGQPVNPDAWLKRQ